MLLKDDKKKDAGKSAKKDEDPAQVGSQWKDIYQFLCNASEREVAAFSNGYTADHERAYAALQHWTIRGPEASLAQLISALRQHRRNDVVEKIRGLMEDTAQVTQPSCLSFPLTFRSLSSRFYQVYVRREKNCLLLFSFTHTHTHTPLLGQCF